MVFALDLFKLRFRPTQSIASYNQPEYTMPGPPILNYDLTERCPGRRGNLAKFGVLRCPSHSARNISTVTVGTSRVLGVTEAWGYRRDGPKTSSDPTIEHIRSTKSLAGRCSNSWPHSLGHGFQDIDHRHFGQLQGIYQYTKSRPRLNLAHGSVTAYFT